MTASRFVGICVLLCGCRTGGAANRPVARYDTLPSGAIEVINDQPTAWSTAAEGWRLTEVARFGGIDGSRGELAQPGQLSVDDFGQVYVVDQRPPGIKVFAPDGRMIRTIGQQGSGPGEFQQAMIAVRGSAVAVYDPKLGRISIFDTSGTFVRSWRSCCGWSDIHIDRANRLYIPISPVGRAEVAPGPNFVRYRLDGSLVDTVQIIDRPSYWWNFPNSTGGNRGDVAIQVPGTPLTVFTFHPDSGFMLGWTGEYRLIRSYRGSDTAFTFRRSWRQEPLSDGWRAAQVQVVIREFGPVVGEAVARAVAKLEDVPTTAPAYVDATVDELGQTWVRRMSLADSSRTVFDVFGGDGTWLGEVSVPLATPEWGGRCITRDRFFATIEDRDGRPVIVQLKIER